MWCEYPKTDLGGVGGPKKLDTRYHPLQILGLFLDHLRSVFGCFSSPSHLSPSKSWGFVLYTDIFLRAPNDYRKVVWQSIVFSSDMFDWRILKNN